MPFWSTVVLKFTIKLKKHCFKFFFLWNKTKRLFWRKIKFIETDGNFFIFVTFVPRQNIVQRLKIFIKLIFFCKDKDFKQGQSLRSDAKNPFASLSCRQYSSKICITASIFYKLNTNKQKINFFWVNKNFWGNLQVIKVLKHSNLLFLLSQKLKNCNILVLQPITTKVKTTPVRMVWIFLLQLI